MLTSKNFLAAWLVLVQLFSLDKYLHLKKCTLTCGAFIDLLDGAIKVRLYLYFTLLSAYLE